MPAKRRRAGPPEPPNRPRSSARRCSPASTAGIPPPPPLLPRYPANDRPTRSASSEPRSCTQDPHPETDPTPAPGPSPKPSTLSHQSLSTRSGQDVSQFDRECQDCFDNVYRDNAVCCSGETWPTRSVSPSMQTTGHRPAPDGLRKSAGRLRGSMKSSTIGLGGGRCESGAFRGRKGEVDADGTEHDRGLWPLGGGVSRRGSRAAIVPPGAVPGRRDRRVAERGARAAARLLDAARRGRSPAGAGPARADLRRVARRAPELATPLWPADGGRLPQAGRIAGTAPGRARPARPRRQQVFRLAEDRPDERPAPSHDEGAPRRLLRQGELGQRAGQAGLRRPGPRRIRVRQPARPGRRRVAGAPQEPQGGQSGIGRGDQGIQQIRRRARAHHGQEPLLRRDHLARDLHGRGPAARWTTCARATTSTRAASAARDSPAVACAPATSGGSTSGSAVPAASA